MASRCIQGSCYEECATDDDCAPSPEWTCQPVDRGGDTEQSVNVCATRDLFANHTSPEGTMCEEDTRCQQAFGDVRARCGLLGSCIIPAEEHALLITDRSMRGQPGAELLAVFIEDPTGVTTIELVMESYMPLEPLTSEVPAGWNEAFTIDDMAPCIDAPDTAPSLALGGDGGSVRMVAQDTRGMRQLLSKGWRLVVIERGPACVETELADPLEITLCMSLAGDELDNSTQCTRMLPLQGEGRTTAIISFDSRM